MVFCGGRERRGVSSCEGKVKGEYFDRGKEAEEGGRRRVMKTEERQEESALGEGRKNEPFPILRKRTC